MSDSVASEDPKVLEFPAQDEPEVLDEKKLTIRVQLLDGERSRPAWDMEGIDTTVELGSTIALFLYALSRTLKEDDGATEDGCHAFASVLMHEIHHQYSYYEVKNRE